ncbi:NADP-dependent oxidoreductase [Nocardioides immobilis]|uniref:NADP-dependent oxidoreductase n=1 Tax=Nocardioides immobilis TaxID=2049295 RepID=A0A417XT14_9ACTN|nr:NADP-dependent oxidoreductase [Nocardioides immobilis]RHW23466.1 NADP-dependent oxidoreductase [Nocardioides immobilis]
MRALVIDGFGGPEQLRVAEVPTPTPGEGEVLVEVAYAGMNPADWKCREGWLAPFFDYRFPFVLGFDLAGTVAEVGPGVTEVAVGDRVAGYTKQGMGEWGSYAQYAVVLSSGLEVLPDHVPLHEAAALPTAGIAAWEGVFGSGQVAEGSAVLVHGASGGVGGYAVQIARNAGARVAATCRADNADYVRGLGAELVIDYRTGSVADAVRSWAPEGIDLVVDAVGQGTLLSAVDMVRPGGRIAPIATLVPDEVPHDAAAAESRGVRVVPTMTTYDRSGTQLRDLVALLADGAITSPEVEIVGLDAAADAHRRIADGHVRGKVVLALDAVG